MFQSTSPNKRPASGLHRNNNHEDITPAKQVHIRPPFLNQPVQKSAEEEDEIREKGESAAQFAAVKEEEEEELQAKADPVQKSENKTGMPDNLKSGVEQLSGFDMSDVRVFYNSAKPAQVQAHAYTQGADIHVAARQEKYLPHEVWHAAQQKQGRVQPTTEVGGLPVNDNAALEKEADEMGGKAMQMKEIHTENVLSTHYSNHSLQRYEFISTDGNSTEITTYQDLLGKCGEFNDFHCFSEALNDQESFKAAVRIAFGKEMFDICKEETNEKRVSEEKKEEVKKRFEPRNKEIKLVLDKLYEDFKNNIDAEVKNQNMFLFEYESEGRMTLKDSKKVLCELFTSFIKDSLDKHRERIQNERLEKTKQETENFSSTQKRWLEEHKADHYIDKKEGKLNIYEGGSIIGGESRKEGTQAVKEYIDQKVAEGHPIYHIMQKIACLKNRETETTLNDNALNWKVVSLNRACSLSSKVYDWMLMEKELVSLSVDGIDNDNKLDGFNLVMTYKGQTKKGLEEIVTYIAELESLEEKKIIIGPSLTKEKVKKAFFENFQNEDSVAGSIVNHPGEGKTGFTVSGLPVYHSSSGSSNANKPGTVFWTYDSKGASVTIIAQGGHTGNKNDEYLISHTLPGVTVTTSGNAKIVKLNTSTNCLGGSF